MGVVENGKLPKPLTWLLNTSRKYSLWAYQWGLACCAIEMGAAFASPRYDVMRLGVIPFPSSPRQADFVVDGWYGMLAPARTPKPIVDKLSADINKALKDPDSLEKWKTLGFDPIGSTPAEFAKRQKDDLAYWKQMIDYTGVKVE